MSQEPTSTTDAPAIPDEREDGVRFDDAWWDDAFCAWWDPSLRVCC